MDTFHDCAPKSKDVWYEIGSNILVYFIERRSEEVKFTTVIKTYKLQSSGYEKCARMMRYGNFQFHNKSWFAR